MNLFSLVAPSVQALFVFAFLFCTVLVAPRHTRRASQSCASQELAWRPPCFVMVPCAENPTTAQRARFCITRVVVVTSLLICELVAWFCSWFNALSSEVSCRLDSRSLARGRDLVVVAGTADKVVCEVRAGPATPWKAAVAAMLNSCGSSYYCFYRSCYSCYSSFYEFEQQRNLTWPERHHTRTIQA